MQLFYNFDNLPPDYVPNNMFMRIPEIMEALTDDTVHPIFKDCRLIGYRWNCGDYVQLEINNQIDITIPAESIVVDIAGEAPTQDTEGTFPGQKYYNTADIKSYTLDSILDLDDDEKMYVWVEDERFTYAVNGVEHLTVQLPWNEGDFISIRFKNFRGEIISEKKYYDTPAIWTLTPEESELIVPGIYSLDIQFGESEDEQITKRELTNSYEIVVTTADTTQVKKRKPMEAPIDPGIRPVGGIVRPVKIR